MNSGKILFGFSLVLFAVAMMVTPSTAAVQDCPGTGCPVLQEKAPALSAGTAMTKTDAGAACSCLPHATHQNEC